MADVITAIEGVAGPRAARPGLRSVSADDAQHFRTLLVGGQRTDDLTDPNALMAFMIRMQGTQVTTDILAKIVGSSVSAVNKLTSIA